MRFVIGVLLGIGLGVCVGLLTATKPGSETREALRQRMPRSAEDPEEA